MLILEENSNFSALASSLSLTMLNKLRQYMEKNSNTSMLSNILMRYLLLPVFLLQGLSVEETIDLSDPFLYDGF